MKAPEHTAAPEPGPGHEAARAARNAFDGVLFALAEIPLDFDRSGMRDRLLRGVQFLYAVIDTPVLSAAHFEGLGQAAAVAAECAAILDAIAPGEDVPAKQRAVERLRAAEVALRKGGEAVAQIQMDRRTEVFAGPPGAPIPPRPFRASVGLPRLQAFPRLPLAPHIALGAPPAPKPDAPPPATPLPTTAEELQAFARAGIAASIAETAQPDDEERAPARVDRPPPLFFEPASSEVEVLRRVARDCLEDVAIHRTLRQPNVMEGWLDQAPFEQRLLDNLDAFLALGGAVLPLVSLYHAEAPAPDPERAFAVALTLGSVEGSDTLGAALMTLKQSPPEELPGWLDGFWLAPSPAVDAAMIELCDGDRLPLIELALDVLHARGTTPPALLAALLGRPEPPIARRVARAFATTAPRAEAIAQLERLALSPDDALFLEASESLLRRGHAPALDPLRLAADGDPSPRRRDGARELLALAGRASDLDRLLAALHAAPSPALLRAIGRFGHVASLDALVGLLHHEDEEMVAAAAEALARITGAGLLETIEETWEIELPPEVLAAGGIPIPTRMVERVVIDPERWTAWLLAHRKRFDLKRKTRGGLLFEPLLIVAELAHRGTPPARRAEAARELALVTAIPSRFSPDDWIARQERDLSVLRERVAALTFSPGAWSTVHVHAEEEPVEVHSTPAFAAPEPASPAPPPSQASPPLSLAPTTLPIPPLVAAAPALPFQAPTSPRTGDPAAPAPTDALTLDQYASLCAELAASPQAADLIFARYGLASTNLRLRVDLAWQERLRRNPLEYRRWQQLYRRHHALFVEKARRGG